MVAVAKLVLDGKEIVDGIEMPGLGKASVDVANKLDQGRQDHGHQQGHGRQLHRPGPLSQSGLVASGRPARMRRPRSGAAVARWPFLELSHISKTFGGVHALRDVDLSLEAGEVHCLVGENGSGKSTLIKIISGVQPPETGGAIVIDGQRFEHLTPAESTRLGIQVIYQDLSLFPNLSVAENIAIAGHVGGVACRRLAQDARDAPRPRWRGSASRSTPTPRSPTFRSPTASSSRSAAPWPPTRASSSWTSRPRRSPATRSTRSSRSSATSRRRASPSCSSPTASTR